MVKVKLVSQHKMLWRRQLPAWECRWENCEFLFDEDAQGYDYFVVWDEPPADMMPFTCPRANTILIVTEPFSVKVYPPSYTEQFGIVISPQEPFTVKHPNIIHTQTALTWSYGIAHNSQHNPNQSASSGMGFDELAAMPSPTKDNILSTVCSRKGAEVSPKQYKSPRVFHRHRLDFTQALKRDLPQLDFYGKGFYPIADKADAINGYKYHLTIENYSCGNYWTEKPADAYLGYALPIYHGCPNLHEFFPEESYIRINIYDYPAALRTIKAAIENDEYEKRLPAIKEARKRLLYEHNLFALLCRTVNAYDGAGAKKAGGVIKRKISFKGRRLATVAANLATYMQYKRLKYKRSQYVKSKIAELGDITFEDV